MRSELNSNIYIRKSQERITIYRIGNISYTSLFVQAVFNVMTYVDTVRHDTFANMFSRVLSNPRKYNVNEYEVQDVCVPKV